MAGDQLDQFITEMLEAKKLSGLDDNVREQLVADLKQELLDQINRVLIDALPDDKLDQLNTMLEDDGKSDNEIQQFVASSGIDVQGLTVRTMLDFRALYLQTAEERG